MLPPVCFETGRFTLTQSSRTAFYDCSRKWMSGPAATWVIATDHRRFFKLIVPTLRELPSTGKSPFFLDSYLSWMSPACPSLSGQENHKARGDCSTLKEKHDRQCGSRSRELPAAAMKTYNLIWTHRHRRL